jgi:CubicO group peptidase (beta-lactamase class C family)
VLGDLVATASACPLERYLDVEVFAPLEMERTHLGGPAGHGVHGTLDDLLRFARELLAPTLLDRDPAGGGHRPWPSPGWTGSSPASAVQTPNDWGLGFELKGTRAARPTTGWARALSPRTFGHFGLSGAFLWVDPTRGVAAAELADRQFGDWARDAWGPFNDQLADTTTP